MNIDPHDYRETIGLFATGVTVITADAGAEIHGMTANAVTSLSLDPLLLLVCIDRRARMAGIIVEAGRFSVNMLRADQDAVSRHFAGRPDPNLNLAFDELAGVPALADSLGAVACSIERVLDGGDHLIVIGRVEGLRRAEAGTPLLYYRGQYRQIAA